MSIPDQIFVVGAKGSGKTEFARALKDELDGSVVSAAGWRIAECGEILARRLAARLAHLPGEARATDEILRWIREHKEDYRAALRHEGDQLAVDAPAKLLAEASSNARIVVGPRRRSEVNAFYGNCAAPWISHCWIFVERPGTGLGDAVFERGFFEVQVCREHIVNDGDLVKLERAAAALVGKWTA